MTTEPSNEVPDADARPTDMDQEVAETGTRPDLVWDDEVPGLCVRVHGVATGGVDQHNDIAAVNGPAKLRQ
jgi:hypothetical protein